jgi:hypothetical protein
VQIIKLQDSIITKQEERYKNCFIVNNNCVTIIKNDNKIIDELKKQIKKEKRNKIIAIISGSLLTILAILAF